MEQFSSMPVEAKEEALFRSAVKRLRKESNWLQKDLADKMVEAGWKDYSQTTVSRLESGQRPVTLGESRAIAKIFKVSLADMISEQTEAPRKIQQLLRTQNTADIEWQNLHTSLKKLAKLRFRLHYALQEFTALNLDPEALSSLGYSIEEINHAVSNSKALLDTDSITQFIAKNLDQVPTDYPETKEEDIPWELFNQIDWNK